MKELVKVSRFELIDHTKDGGGRVFVKYKNNMKILTSVQDEDRTLKVFIDETKEPIPTSKQKVKQMYAFMLLRESAIDTNDKQLQKVVDSLAKYIRNNP